MAIYHLHVSTGSRQGGQSARAKYDYIMRRGKYNRGAQDEVVWSASANMPKWAAEHPEQYWAAADDFERANGRLFKQVEAALPRELSLKQQVNLAHVFAQRIAGTDLPYSIAIHSGKGGNPHLHLIISERINDGLDRPPEVWFKRANKQNPERGGAIKTKRLKPKDWLQRTRKDWAALANRALEVNGSKARIDYRSHADRGIKTQPQIHVGPNVKGMAKRLRQQGRDISWLERLRHYSAIAKLNKRIRETLAKIRQWQHDLKKAQERQRQQEYVDRLREEAWEEFYNAEPSSGSGVDFVQAVKDVAAKQKPELTPEEPEPTPEMDLGFPSP